MEKVVGNKKAKLWFICAVMLAIVLIYLSSIVSVSLLQGHAMLILVGTMAIMMIIYILEVRKGTLRIFEGKTYQKIDITDPDNRKMWFIMAITTGIGTTVIFLFGGDNLSFFVIYPILAFSNLVLGDVYIGENLIVYYNNVLKLDEIERCSKEDKIARRMVRYWVNGKSYKLDFQDVYDRDKFYELLSERIGR